jgi:hypothetical protein
MKEVLGAMVLMAGSVVAQAPDRAADLAAIREYALSYTEKLPNYTATQSVKRVTKPTQQGRYTMGGRTQTENVEEQITYVEGRELHKILTVNGQAVKEYESESGGMYSRGEFALLLSAIFRPETKTEFRFDRTAKLSGAPMVVFAFSVPQLPNGYGIMEGKRTLVVPYKGFVFANAETHAVMRIQMTCTNIPQVSQYRGVELTLDYKVTKVAGQEFILPSRYTTNLRRIDSDVTMDASYKDFKKFGADATIIFEEEPPQ